MPPRTVTRRAVSAGIAATAIAAPVAIAAKPQNIGDLIDVYDENNTNFKTAYNLGARAVLHETNYFKLRDGRSTKYKERKRAARDMHILWGAFMMMTDELIEDQYNRLMAVEDFSDGQTLLSLDWESPGYGKKAASYATLKAFVDRIVHEKNFFPLIYGSNFITDNPHFKAGDMFFANCPLWIAAPGTRTPKLPEKTWPKFTLWQYQFDDPRVSKADWSHFNGTYEEMQARWPLNGKKSS